MRFLRRSLTGLFLASLTVAALAMAAYVVRDAVEARLAQDGGAMPNRERVYTADVVRVVPETVTPVLEAFGEVVSRRNLEIRSAVGGTVVELGENFVEGGRVQSGQMLVRIDATDLEDAVSLGRADLSDAEAELANAEAVLTLERDDLTSARRQVELRNAAVQRQQDLLDRGVGTAADLETATLSAASAEQAVLAARATVNAAEARVASAGTAMERARIALAEAERNLSDATITADFSGALADVAAIEGRLVTANEQLATLVDPETLEASFRLSTAQYARLLDEAGDLVLADVSVSLDVAGVDLIATGRIARESAAVGEGQTGRLIFARLDQAVGFRPGDFVTVRILEPALDNVARIPAAAVSGTDEVLVVEQGGRLSEASVDVVRRQGETVLIAADTLAGREIVAERAPTLGAGIRIRPNRDPSDPAAGNAGDENAEAPRDNPNLITLDDERRAKLIAFVEGSARFPMRAKERILTTLRQPEVPAQMVERIESNMGS
ncbi:efflux RND transporter periplasmic adaptor subunit [Maritimibacter dapengensis]|uniref:Efflux RND transporter periplasmic adaptor subunit n=1 Tax=Maritimibacter dapengensis TaxID=2836868 RepID=A0ABS6SWT2_9RHOB|nr:efflux RND transporter periplasmic adaptor subunit [Maritimibacter dapengensis]MBV7377375.1 efflux RND transporter periplasmic adaptor subunit [Maritimibacter dapengensis]